MELRKNAHPIFEPQHKNKCYCTNIFSCRCKLKEAISSKPERSKPNLSLNSTSRHKFVKIRRENTGAQSMQTTKQNVEETLSAIASGPNSRCSSQCTTSHFTGRATPSENSLQVSESRHQLTDRRQQYERSKELINQAKLDQFNMCHIIPSHDVTHTLCGGANDRMIELQKFRMRNPNDCFNVQKQHAITMEQRLDDYGMERVGIMCKKPAEHSYFLNDRGLLELDVGQPITTTSKAKINRSKATSPKIVPFVTNTQSVAQQILRQKILAIKNNDIEAKRNLQRKIIFFPSNSLALRFQESY